MNSAPDDILRLIFKAYTYDLGCSPASLLTVNRRWNATLLSMRSIWSRIHIYITSLDTIPSMLQDPDVIAETPHSAKSTQSPLRSYLSRSSPPNDPYSLPLDITITWYETRQEIEVIEEAIEETSEFIPLSEVLERFEKQISQLLLELATSSAEEKPINSDDRTSEARRRRIEENCRLKSLELDLGGVSNGDYEFFVVNFRSLTEYGFKLLPRLESLKSQGVELNLAGLQTPHLTVFDLQGGAIKCFPAAHSLEHLTIIECEVTPEDGFGFPDWRECSRLQTLHISHQRYLQVPIVDPFPNLTTIRFDSPMAQYLLRQLGGRFNKERPLKLLCVAEHGFIDIVIALRAVPKFHMERIGVSSQRFRPADNCIRKDYETERGECISIEWTDPRIFMLYAERRKVEVEAMDAQVQALLDAYPR